MNKKSAGIGPPVSDFSSEGSDDSSEFESESYVSEDDDPELNSNFFRPVPEDEREGVERLRNMFK